jgi:hypothetical protein
MRGPPTISLDLTKFRQALAPALRSAFAADDSAPLPERLATLMCRLNADGHLEQWSILPRDGAQCRVLFSI